MFIPFCVISKNFTAVAFTFRVLIHLKLIFIHGTRLRVKIYVFLSYRNLGVLASVVDPFFLYWLFLLVCENSNAHINVGLSCLIHLLIPCQYHTVDLLVKALNSGSISPPTLVLFFMIALALLGHLHFDTHFRISLSISKEKSSEIFMIKITESVSHFVEN